MRIGFLFAVFLHISPVYAQNSESPALERLTWEEIARDTPPYPFEARVLECIHDHRTNDTFILATHCRAIPYEYLPEYTGMIELDFTEWQGAQKHQAYIYSFWRHLLDQANDAMVEYVLAELGQPYPERRAAELNDANVLFFQWIEVKCSLEQSVFDSVGSHWRFVDYDNCRVEEISKRALELIAMRRLYVP